MTTELAVASQTASLVPTNIQDAMSLATFMSKASLVPTHLQGKPADCLLVIEQAARWGLSPFAVAQATSVIQGKLMFEGKLVMAVINAKAALEERLSFTYSGSGNDRKVTVSGRFRGEKQTREVDVFLKDARTNNRMWQTQPDQQLAYHGARVWARRHAPEIMLGVYSEEEMAGPQAEWRDQPPEVQAIAIRGITPGTGVMGLADSTPDVEPIEPPEEYTEPVPVYDAETGEQVRTSPKLTSAQNAKIHVLLNQCGHHMDESKRGKDGHAGEIVKLGKYRKKLTEKYGKQHTNELSIIEANWVIDWLTRCVAKLERAADTRQSSPLPATPENKESEAILQLTIQLNANGHRTMDAKLGWMSNTLGRTIKAASELTDAEVAKCLAIAEGQV